MKRIFYGRTCLGFIDDDGEVLILGRTYDGDFGKQDVVNKTFKQIGININDYKGAKKIYINDGSVYVIDKNNFLNVMG
jgi:hypothetical protein